MVLLLRTNIVAKIFKSAKEEVPDINLERTVKYSLERLMYKAKLHKEKKDKFLSAITTIEKVFCDNKKT